MNTDQNFASPLQHPDKLFIDGQWLKSESGEMIDVISPATEEVYVRVAAANEQDIDKAIKAARDAFDAGPWPRLSHAERAEYLRAVAVKVKERIGDIATIWPNEMGITHQLAQIYSSFVGGIYKYYANLANTFPFEEEHKTYSGAKVGLLVREPVGVVGAIIPWNGPASQIAYKIAPALLAGCTVVIKASPEAPSHALLMAEIFEEVGFPKGVVNVLTANSQASARLVNHHDVDKIAFTGSSATGKKIAETMGARMGRYTLELGGKSAAVILDDYDIELAAKNIAGNTCAMTGQVCAALTRIIVPKQKHDQFLEALASQLLKVTVGDPFDPATKMGPLATKNQLEIVEKYIQSGKDQGFTLATGGQRPAHLEPGYYIEPTVFGNVDNLSNLAQEEIFGPVLSVIPSESMESALAMANDSLYGLNGAVFTNDVDQAYAFARQLRSGTVGHNSFRMDLGIAFGGFKQSGVGREGGVEGLLPFLESKTILLDGMPSHRT